MTKKHWRQTAGATNFIGIMTRFPTLAAVVALLLCLAPCPALAADDAAPRSAITRPPAVPLVTHDPYFSFWSVRRPPHRRLAQALDRPELRHGGLVRVDGKTYRLMGGEGRGGRPAAEQSRLQVTADRHALRIRAARCDRRPDFISPAAALRPGGTLAARYVR